MNRFSGGGWIDERTVASVCRVCGERLDAATAAISEHATPVPGDVSVCFYCATVSIYADDMTLRAPTPEERRELDASDEVTRVVRSILQSEAKNN